MQSKQSISGPWLLDMVLHMIGTQLTRPDLADFVGRMSNSALEVFAYEVYEEVQARKSKGEMPKTMCSFVI